MKRRLLPKVWRKEIYFKDKDIRKKYKGSLEFYARFGAFTSSEIIGVQREKVYIFPCLCFSFKRSELFVMFAWLNFFCFVKYNDWNRYYAYIEKKTNK